VAKACDWVGISLAGRAKDADRSRMATDAECGRDAAANKVC